MLNRYLCTYVEVNRLLVTSVLLCTMMSILLQMNSIDYWLRVSYCV